MTSISKANTIRCPYMPQHVMAIDSLLTHLNRCKATNKHLFKTCPYNSLHIILKQHLNEHVKTCDDKRKFQQGYQEDQWEMEERKKNEQVYSNYYRNNSNHSSSNSSDFKFVEDSSEQDQGYGYYDYFDGYNYSMRNEADRVQYTNFDLQQHSNASFCKDKHLSYLAPASLTIPKKEKKQKIKANVTNLPNYQTKSEISRNMNKSSINQFKNQEKPVIIVRSEQDTIENSNSLQSKRKMKNKNEEEDDQILILIKQIANDKLNISGDCKDELGDVLIEQAMMLKQKRNCNNTNNSMLSMY